MYSLMCIVKIQIASAINNTQSIYIYISMFRFTNMGFTTLFITAIQEYILIYFNRNVQYNKRCVKTFNKYSNFKQNSANKSQKYRQIFLNKCRVLRVNKHINE